MRPKSRKPDSKKKEVFMFAGGERINMFPSQLLLSATSNESAGGEKITDGEACKLRAVVDAYQHGQLYVPNGTADNFQMNAISQIKALLGERKPVCDYTYEVGSYDQNQHLENLIGGTVLLVGAGAGPMVISGVVFLVLGPEMILIAIPSFAVGAFGVYSSHHIMSLEGKKPPF